MKHIHFIFFLHFFAIQLSAKQPWSEMYKRIFTSQEQHDLYGKHSFIYHRDSVMPFTQLIVSWNAQRPESGEFLLKARVRHADTKKWDTWHTIASWGKHQKSFFSRGAFSTFHYSRLEVEGGAVADAFEVALEGTQDATMDTVSGIFVCVSNQSAFIPESYHGKGLGLPSYKVKRAVKKSQMMIDHPRANVLCSPTSISMVVQTLHKQPVDPLITAQYVYDPSLNVFGNWAFNVAHAFEIAGGNYFFYTARPSSFKEIYACLKKNMPVAVSIRGTIKGGKKSYNNGHLLVIVGWDARHKKVICFDPRFDELAEVKREYDFDEFIPAWERSRRLTYMPECIL